MEKPYLKSKIFPAKIPFFKIQKKILAGKIYFTKERGPFLISIPKEIKIAVDSLKPWYFLLDASSNSPSC